MSLIGRTLWRCLLTICSCLVYLSCSRTVRRGYRVRGVCVSVYSV